MTSYLTAIFLYIPIEILYVPTELLYLPIESYIFLLILTIEIGQATERAYLQERHFLDILFRKMVRFSDLGNFRLKARRCDLKANLRIPIKLI